MLNSRTSILFKDDIEYFTDLEHKTGKWARNDFYNFINIFPPLNRVEIEVIQIYMGNYPAYVYADRADRILKYSYVSRRRGDDEGYQRMVEFSRIKEMAKKLKSKEISGFPNSILLNSTINIVTNPLPKSQCPAVIKINLPNHYSSCRVVDGQHRLLSFTHLDFNEITHFNIPIVLVDNMPIEEEVKLFLEINNTPKRVDPSLRYELISKIDWDESDKEFMIKRAVGLIKKLEKNSPLGNKIFRGVVDDESKLNKITLRSAVDSILAYDLLREDKINDLFEYIKQFLISIKQNANQDSLDYFFSNRGIDLIFAYIDYLLGNIDTGEVLETDENDSNNLIRIVDENIQTLNKYQGKQGFQNAIALVKNNLNHSLDERSENVLLSE